MISGYGPALRPDQPSHPHADVMTPGRTARVLQRSPATIIQAEHTELAALIRAESIKALTTA
jgi:hypothetical protein